ncbi:MAG: hypothetical protein U1E59_20185 [Amaricoccus sp.]
MLKGLLAFSFGVFMVASHAFAGPFGTPQATLAVAGPHVLVNGARAQNGSALKGGEQITTGPGSSAKVIWSDGTKLQFDENSSIRSGCEAWIIGLPVGCGWFMVETGKMDIQIVTALVYMGLPSRAAVHVKPDRQFEIYGLAGTLGLMGPHRGHDLQPNEVASYQPSSTPYNNQNNHFRSGCGDRTPIRPVEVYALAKCDVPQPGRARPAFQPELS